MKRALRVKSVGTKVSAAELRVLESRAAAAGLTLSEWVRDVLLGSSVEMGAMAAERTILAEVLAMRTILLNFMLKVGEGCDPGGGKPEADRVGRQEQDEAGAGGAGQKLSARGADADSATRTGAVADANGCGLPHGPRPGAGRGDVERC